LLDSGEFVLLEHPVLGVTAEWLPDGRRLISLAEENGRKATLVVYDTATDTSTDLLSVASGEFHLWVLGPGADTLYFTQHTVRSDIHLLVASDGGDR
jgi:hypothetical protein